MNSTPGLAALGLDVALGGAAVLTGVDLTLRRGEVTVIVGPNGAGKSTLLSCLAGLRRPDRGEVRLDDQPVLALPARRRAQRIGLLSQLPDIAWAVDVQTLAALGRIPYAGLGDGQSPVDRAAVEAALIAADVAALRDRPVTQLSGGERGRALVARALAGAPEWLLADEPMTGLDPAHQLDLATLLQDLAHVQGRGVVVTLHDLTLAARMADRLVVLDKGRVIGDGPVRDVLTPPLFAQVYGVEGRVMESSGGLCVDIRGRV